MSADDIEAINTYVINLPIKTPEAGRLQADWKLWYDGLNFISKSLDSNTDEANNRRGVINAANLQPANLVDAADLTSAQKIDRQAAIAKSPALTPQQKSVAIAKNPNIPTTHDVPSTAVKHATIRQGSKGADVYAWQVVLGIKPDGIFGPGTTSATKSWQTKNGLTADGVVGPKTWSAAIGAPVQEAPVVAFLPPVSPSFAPPKSAQAPLVSPSPELHAAASVPGPVITPVTSSSGTLHVPVIKKSFNIPKAAAAVGIPTVAGAFLGGPVGAFIGAGIGSLVDIFAL